MKMAIFRLLIVAVLVVSCGGGGSDCITIPNYANGGSRETADSSWRCSLATGENLQFAFYLNGTGDVVNLVGGNTPGGSSCEDSAFIWNEPGCGALDVVTDCGSFRLASISGGISSRRLSFRAPETGEQFNCTLQDGRFF